MACRTKPADKKQNRKSESFQQLDDVNDHDDDLLELEVKRRHKRATAELRVNDIKALFTLDSGASVNLLPMHLAEQTGMINTMKPPETTVHMFDDHSLKVNGMIECQLYEPRSGKTMNTSFYIAATHKNPVLGMQTCLEFELVKIRPEYLHNLSETNEYKQLTRDDVLQKHSDLFVGYGKFEGIVHLDTDPKVEPVRVTPRRIPLHIRDKVGKELKSLCDNDIIEPTERNLPWSSHLQPVLKSNGDVRICMSPLALNDALKSVECILPTLDDVLP